MEMPVKSKVDEINLRPHEFMLPIFELVVNALISIGEKRDGDKGLIRIFINREQNAGMFDSASLVDKEGNILPAPIESVSVHDNGVGFNDTNFKSFNTAYSDRYRNKGCKGVGRFTALACFEKMTVQSVFQENNQRSIRAFTFDTANEVTPIETPSGEKSELIGTGAIVTLSAYYPKFKERSSISTREIAKAIIEHCLPFFYQPNAPTVVLSDTLTEEEIVLNDVLREIVSIEGEQDNFKLKDKSASFSVLIVRRKDARSHRLLLCAHNRVVGKATNLARLIPGFESPFHERGEEYCVDVYLQSPYLDNNVNTVRNSFDIPTSAEDGLFEEVSIDKIQNAVSGILKTKYEDVLDTVYANSLKKIKQYILNPKKPRLTYRSLLSKPELLKTIPSNASEETIEEHLHRIKFSLEKDLNKKVKSALKRGAPENPEEYSEIVKGILSQEAEFTKDKLADLLIQRKAILKLFRKMLKLTKDGSYKLEEDVHNIIFPMGQTNDSLPYEYHNLWLLDERLAFHSFIASDKTLKSNPIRKMESSKEPDLLFFDFPWAFSEAETKMNSVVIFEFKRPGRDMDTSEDRNLDSQIMEYFQKLMESRAKDYNGELVNLEKTTPKFGYVICDVHRDLANHNIEYNNFNKTPFGTLYKHNDKLNLHIEVLNYKQMLDMSEQRHQAFFRELGMDDE